MTSLGTVMVLAEVTVTGHPKTKGSLEVVTKTHVREKPGSARWRALVVERLRTGRREWEREWNMTHPEGPTAVLGQSYTGRVGVLIVNYLQPPASWSERVQEWLCSQFSGDADKLARNVLDAAVDAGVIADDGQVMDLYCHKRLAHSGMLPGQRIQIWCVPEEHEW